MKVIRSIARLAILCLLLFPVVLHAQTTGGKPKHSSDKTKQNPKSTVKGSKKVDAKSDAGTKPAVSPTVGKTASPTPTPEGTTEVAKTQKEPQDRTDIVPPARSWTSVLTFSNFLPVIPIFLSLVALGGLLYIVYSFHARLDEIAVWQHNSQRTVQELKQSLKDNKEYAERVEANLSRIADDLGLRIESAKRNSEEAKRLARAREAQANTPEPLRAELTNDVPLEPSFPSLVADYLSRLRASQPTAVDADFRTNKLITAAAESAPFVFIADGDGSGAGIVLPRARLQRSQEFSSYYKDYYHCPDPTAGEVFIIEPAVVRPDGNGWRLSQMGRMEIR